MRLWPFLSKFSEHSGIEMEALKASYRFLKDSEGGPLPTGKPGREAPFGPEVVATLMLGLTSPVVRFSGRHAAARAALLPVGGRAVADSQLHDGSVSVPFGPEGCRYGAMTLGAMLEHVVAHGEGREALRYLLAVHVSEDRPFARVQWSFARKDGSTMQTEEIYAGRASSPADRDCGVRRVATLGGDLIRLAVCIADECAEDELVEALVKYRDDDPLAGEIAGLAR